MPTLTSIGRTALYRGWHESRWGTTDGRVQSTRDAGRFEDLNSLGETYDTLNQYAETISLDGIPVRTVNLEGLLRTKQTMRDKDVADRIVLERALQTVRGKV